MAAGGAVYYAVFRVGPPATDDAGAIEWPAGSVRTAAFRLGDQAYGASRPGPLDAFNRGLSIYPAGANDVSSRF